MLILTRRVGETMMIGNDVTVTVLGVKGMQMRVGVNASKSVAVHREEIYALNVNKDSPRQRRTPHSRGHIHLRTTSEK